MPASQHHPTAVAAEKKAQVLPLRTLGCMLPVPEWRVGRVCLKLLFHQLGDEACITMRHMQRDVCPR